MTISYKGRVVDSQVIIIPSEKLRKFIKNLDKSYSDISRIEYLVTASDKEFLKTLKSQFTEISPERPFFENVMQKSCRNDVTDRQNGLSINDIHCIYNYIQQQNKKRNTKIYLHELLEGSVIVMPENEVIPRNEELDKRCQDLKAQQQNKEYLNMTKNVNSSKKSDTKEDTLCNEIRMMNRHLIAILQYIISIITGFAFGFYGIEMLTLPLDLGFRLLLGVMCGLAIALAELYFLARALTKDSPDDAPISHQKTFKIS